MFRGCHDKSPSSTHFCCGTIHNKCIGVKHHSSILSEFCRSGALVGPAGFFTLGLTRQRSSIGRAGHYLEALRKICFQAHSGYGQNSVPCGCGLSLLFFTGCQRGVSPSKGHLFLHHVAPSFKPASVQRVFLTAS